MSTGLGSALALERSLSRTRAQTSSSSRFSPLGFQEVAGTNFPVRPRHWKHPKAQGCGRGWGRNQWAYPQNSERPRWYHSWCLGAWDTKQNVSRSNAEKATSVEEVGPIYGGISLAFHSAGLPPLKYSPGRLSGVFHRVWHTADLAESGRTGRRRGWQNEAVGVYLWFLVTVLNTSWFHLAMPETLGLLSHRLATYETGRQLGRVEWKLFWKRKALLAGINSSHVAWPLVLPAAQILAVPSLITLKSTIQKSKNKQSYV